MQNKPRHFVFSLSHYILLGIIANYLIIDVYQILNTVHSRSAFRTYDLQCPCSYQPKEPVGEISSFLSCVVHIKDNNSFCLFQSKCIRHSNKVHFVSIINKLYQHSSIHQSLQFYSWWDFIITWSEEIVHFLFLILRRSNKITMFFMWKWLKVEDSVLHGCPTITRLVLLVRESGQLLLHDALSGICGTTDQFVLAVSGNPHFKQPSSKVE